MGIKGLFLIHTDEDTAKASGIDQKVNMQIKYFNNNDIKCTPYILKDSMIKNKLLEKLLIRLPFINTRPVWKYDGIFSKVDFIYFRRPANMNIYMVNILRKIKINNTKCKIIMEIPTYPFKKEYDKFYDKTLLWKTNYHIRNLKGLIDKYVIIGDVDNTKEIFGVSTIKYKNGYDLSQFKIRNSVGTNGIINFLCLAIFNKWHGYDRLLKGLSSYYKNGGNKNIVIHFVGDGPEVNEYMKITKYEKLESHVKFYGKMKLDDIDPIFDICDIAICTLGNFRRGVFESSELKIRQYLAKGVPIVTACKIDIFENEDFEYRLNYPNDNSEIEIKDILKFYKGLYEKKSKKDVALEIRKFAEKEIDMSVTIRPIIKYITGE